jgi:hypothetical protein
VLLLAPRRWTKIEVFLWQRGTRGRADPAADQGTDHHPDRSSNQADGSPGSGTGGRTTAGPISCGLPATRDAAEQQYKQYGVTHGS